MGNARRFILVIILMACACGPRTGESLVNETENVANERSTISAPANPTIELQAEPIDAKRVRFVVTTNIPTPVQVMIGVGLAGQAPDDTFIGHSERMTLTGPTTTQILDTAAAERLALGRALPTGRYIADVSFYPRWGAEGNPAAAGIPELHAEQTIELTGSGQSSADAVLTTERQRWVTENVHSNVPWDEERFVRQLGRFEKSQASLSHLHDAYYFPGADMTLIVNRLRNEVSIWRVGRASR